MTLLLFQLALAAPLITGTVVDEHGQPVIGAQIDAAQVMGRGVSYRGGIVTDIDGRFAVPEGEGVQFVRVQARMVDGRTSEVAFPTRFPAELALQLRPPAEVELTGFEGPVEVTAYMHRNEIVELGSVLVHQGTLDGSVLSGPPGEWELLVSQGERAERVLVETAPGKRTQVRLRLPEPGRLAITRPGVWRDHNTTCLLQPGTLYDSSRGHPTGARCYDLEPAPYPDDFVGGVQTLTVVVEDVGRFTYRLDVRPGTWCHFELPPPDEAALPGGIVGATFDTGAAQGRITAVLPGSPAEQAGLVPGDVVLEVNGQPIDSALGALIAIRASEDKLLLKVGHQGKTRKVKLAKTPEVLPPLVEPERCGDPPEPPPPEEREPYGLPYAKPLPLPLPPDPRDQRKPNDAPKR